MRFCGEIFDDVLLFNTALLNRRKQFASVNHGGLDRFEMVGNILFSNGGLDPWHAYGINVDIVPSTTTMPVIAIPKWCPSH